MSDARDHTPVSLAPTGARVCTHRVRQPLLPLIPAKAGTQAFLVCLQRANLAGRAPGWTLLGPRLRGDERNLGVSGKRTVTQRRGVNPPFAAGGSIPWGATA
jgi:hypothetical protein